MCAGLRPVRVRGLGGWQGKRWRLLVRRHYFRETYDGPPGEVGMSQKWKHAESRPLVRERFGVNAFTQVATFGPECVGSADFFAPVTRGEVPGQIPMASSFCQLR